jgi:hypothetical protein
MSDPKDIVGKADAFLGRYRPGSTPELPVLTDVVDVPGAIPAAAGASSRPEDAPGGPSDAELRAMERQIAQRVLDAIQPALADLVERALASLSVQCRAQLDAAVRDAVAAAVDREMDQLRQTRPPGR